MSHRRYLERFFEDIDDNYSNIFEVFEDFRYMLEKKTVSYDSIAAKGIFR